MLCYTCSCDIDLHNAPKHRNAAFYQHDTTCAGQADGVTFECFFFGDQVLTAARPGFSTFTELNCDGDTGDGSIFPEVVAIRTDANLSLIHI